MARIVIFANGILNQPAVTRLHLRATDRIFCADGGARHALSLDLKPECIIGDLDSLSPEFVAQMKAAGVTIHRFPVDKDKTDLELALELAVAEQPEEILLLAVLGGRLDQMLANLLLLTRPKYASTQLTLVDGQQWATLLRGPRTITISGQPGETLSLIPLTPTVEQVSLSGVAWPLVDANLSFGSTFTISNALVETQATVQVGEGLVLLIHLRKSFDKEGRI